MDNIFKNILAGVCTVLSFLFDGNGFEHVPINVIGDGHVLKTVTVVFYICNECISLIENAGRIGVPVPKKLLDVLEQLRDKDK